MQRSFKGHLISVLAGVSDDFPIQQWDDLLPQTVLTLNLLRQSNVAPNISAYAYHHGSFDYNRMPLISACSPRSRDRAIVGIPTVAQASTLFKDVWNRSAADEFGRLAQGIGGQAKGTDTIRFIHKHEVPQDRFKDVTYIKFVCTIRTEKEDPYRTRATMGGNLIN
jgi:hypothetical protein